MKLLLDEHLSPSLIAHCAGRGFVAHSVAYLDLGGTDDRVIWQYALEHNFTVVTANARHFLQLLNVDLHPGLIVLREGGLTRAEQWHRLARVLDHLAEQHESPASYMVNRVIDVLSADDDLIVRQIPGRSTA